MTDTTSPDRSAFERGIEVAKQVAGDVRSPRLDKDLQKLIIQYAFGEVWSRPGLDITSRRLISLSMTLAGHHLDEFKLHTRFALANGMDRSVIKELILQSAIYCGVPAALDAFRAVEEIYKELDEKEA